MPLDHYLAFVATTIVLLVIPGPTVLMIVAHALAHGRRSAVATVAGVALGDFAAMAASLLGLGALLAASAELFTLLKWVGGAYLVWLGVKMWRAPVSIPSVDGSAAPASHGGGRLFFHAFAVTSLNPKGIVFFVAFLPQFVDPRGNVPFQLAVFGATFLVLATVNASAYALMAGAARRAVRRPGLQRAVNRGGGAFLIGAGLMTALWRRAPA